MICQFNKIVIILIFLCPSVAAETVEKGKSLTQEGFYDEALKILSGLNVKDYEDPTDLLFYRACCHFHLLNKQDAIKDLDALLRLPDLQLRYSHTAQRMLAEIRPLEEDSLDEISRLMKDAGRRVELEQIGKPTTDQQQLIIDKLNKLIEKAEEEQQQQQAAAAAAQQQGQSQKDQKSASPLDKSEYRDTKGAGNADNKNVKMEDGWGNLPPAERQEALQPIVRDLPWHYREAIEAYMRKMAIGE